MIWLTWRQFRASAFTLLGVAAAAMAVLAVSRHQVADLSTSAGADFLDVFGSDRAKSAVFVASTAVVYVLPAVIGIFWGAPMVSRELEAGTYRLVWTQSVTRTRWLAAKLGVAGAAAVAVGLFSLVLTWWCGPLDEAVVKGYRGTGPYAAPRLSPAIFGSRGVVPIAMLVLALVIGVALGLLVRRTVPAMAATLVLVVAVQVVVPMAVQAHLLPKKEVTTTITRDNLTDLRATGDPRAGGDIVIGELEISIGHPGAWITANRTYDPSGQVVERFPAWTKECLPQPGVAKADGSAVKSDGSLAACFARLAAEGYRQHVDYLPASSFWPLQLVETGLLLALAALLTGFCFWRIRRDLS